MRISTRTLTSRNLPLILHHNRIPSPPNHNSTYKQFNNNNKHFSPTNLIQNKFLPINNHSNPSIFSKNTHISYPLMTPQGPCRSTCSRINNSSRSSTKARRLRNNPNTTHNLKNNHLIIILHY